MNRPDFPRNCCAYDPRWVEFQALMATYLDEQSEQFKAWCRENINQGPDPQAEAEGMLTAPRKHKKAAWSGVDREYLAEAKRRQRERDKALPRPCCDCGTGVRLPRKSRCMACSEKEMDRQEAHKNERKTQRIALIREGLYERSQNGKGFPKTR